MLDRSILHFLMIAELGSVAQAARELDVGQPTLSRSLQALELRLGVKLFERRPRGMSLTAVGESLRSRATLARLTLDEAQAEIRMMAAGKTGLIRIGTGHTVGEMVRDALFPKFIKDRPAARVALHAAINVELFELVSAGALDFVVCGVAAGVPSNLQARFLFSDDMVVIVRKRHPLARLRAPRVADVAAYPYAAATFNLRGTATIDRRFLDQGVQTLHRAFEANSMDTVFEVVSRTDMFCVSPWNSGVARHWGEALMPIRVSGASIRGKVAIVTRSGGFISPLAQYAMSLIENSPRVEKLV